MQGFGGPPAPARPWRTPSRWRRCGGQSAAPDVITARRRRGGCRGNGGPGGHGGRRAALGRTGRALGRQHRRHRPVLLRLPAEGPRGPRARGRQEGPAGRGSAGRAAGGARTLRALCGNRRCGAVGEGDPEQPVCGELPGGGAEADAAGAQDGVEQNHPPLERLREDHPPEDQQHPLRAGARRGRRRRGRAGGEAPGGGRAQPGDRVREIPPLCAVLHRRHRPLHQRGAPQGHPGDRADAEGGHGPDRGGRAGPGQRHHQAAAPQAGHALLPERPGFRVLAAEARGRRPLLESPDGGFWLCHLRRALLPPEEAVPAAPGEAAAPADAGGVPAGPGAPGQRRGRRDPQERLRGLPEQHQILRFPGVRPRLRLPPVLPGSSRAQKVPHLQAGHHQGGSLVQQLIPCDSRGGRVWI